MDGMNGTIAVGALILSISSGVARADECEEQIPEERISKREITGELTDEFDLQVTRQESWRKEAPPVSRGDGACGRKIRCVQIGDQYVMLRSWEVSDTTDIGYAKDLPKEDAEICGRALSKKMPLDPPENRRGLKLGLTKESVVDLYGTTPHKDRNFWEYAYTMTKLYEPAQRKSMAANPRLKSQGSVVYYDRLTRARLTFTNNRVSRIRLETTEVDPHD